MGRNDFGRKVTLRGPDNPLYSRPSCNHFPGGRGRKGEKLLSDSAQSISMVVRIIELSRYVDDPFTELHNTDDRLESKSAEKTALYIASLQNQFAKLLR